MRGIPGIGQGYVNGIVGNPRCQTPSSSYQTTVLLLLGSSPLSCSVACSLAPFSCVSFLRLVPLQPHLEQEDQDRTSPHALSTKVFCPIEKTFVPYEGANTSRKHQNLIRVGHELHSMAFHWNHTVY